MMEEEEEEAEEYEVERILSYERAPDGEERFFVKWIGYPEDESSWEPLAHMNENCMHLIEKARIDYVAQQNAMSASFEVAVEEDSPVDATPQPDDVFALGVLPNDSTDSWTNPLPGFVDTAGQQSPVEPVAATDYWGNIVVDDDDGSSPRVTAIQALQAVPKHRTPVAPQQMVVAPQQMVAQPLVAPAARDHTAAFLGSAGGIPGAPAAKRPKLQAPLHSPGVAPGNSHIQQSTEIVEEDHLQMTSMRRPVAREMKCICGSTDKVTAMTSAKDKLLVCRICNHGLHLHCVQGALGKGKIATENYVCPPCRLERVDEFHPPVGPGLLRHSYAFSSSTFTLSFTAQPSQWRKQSWAVHLRAVVLNQEDLGGPAWPHKVQGKLNGRPCVAIEPPKHLHVRREQCYNLTPLLRQGVNQLELRFQPNPNRPKHEEEDSYCVGAVLTRPRSVASIIARIRTRSTETVTSGQLRVRRLIGKVLRKEGREEDCTVTGHFGRILKPVCPVSLCPIEECAIGRQCQHIQVFDVNAYITVNQKMRSLDKRWTCPVCSLTLRPDDVVLDPFAQGILDTLRGDEDLVEAVVFNEDCSWSTISAVKEDAAGGPGASGDDEGGGGGDTIECLSDSE